MSEMTNAELQEMMRRARRVNWITDHVQKATGSVEFALTENGNIGVFLDGDVFCAGVGATVGDAIDDAMAKELRAATTEGGATR